MFDSLEAMLAWRIYERYIIPGFAERCSGVLCFRTAEYGEELARAMTALGFRRAIEAGEHAQVLDGQGSAMTLLGNYRGAPTAAFGIGAQSRRAARSLLGRLAVDHGFEVGRLEWE